MQITSNYYRLRQHQDARELGVSEKMARMMEAATLETEPAHERQAETVQPLRPSTRTLRLLASRYKPTSNKRVA